MIAERHTALDILIDLLISFMLVAYFLIDVYQLWQYKIFGFGISSIIMAGGTVVFLLIVFIQFHQALGLFELFLGLLIIGLGLGAQRYDGKQWFLNFAVYQSFFSLGLAIVITRRPLRSWVIFIPFLVIIGFFLRSIIQFKSIDIAQVLPYMNRNTFSMTVITYGILGSLNLILHGNLKYILNITFAGLTLGLAFLSLSRGGIVVGIGFSGFSVILMFLKMRKEIFKKKSKKKYLVLLIVALVCVIALGIAVDYAIKGTRLATSGFDSNGRKEIYMSFLSSYTWKSILIGVPPSALIGYSHFHNAFFQVLGEGGIIGWVFILVYLITGYQLLRSKHFNLLALFGLISIYSLVEPFVFLAIGDLILFPLIVFAFHTIKLKKNNSVTTI